MKQAKILNSNKKPTRKAGSKMLLFFMSLGFVLNALPAKAQSFDFTFNFGGEAWELSVEADTWDSALTIASQRCLSHFTGQKGNEPIKVDSPTADALIDTCANPR